MDKLDKIVKEQAELFERIAEEHDIGFEDTEDMIRQHVFALNAEVAELQNSVNWKWWTNDHEVDWDNVNEELIDIIFFTVQALILNGNNAEDIYNLYMDKLGVNHQRQDGELRKGYKADSGEDYEVVD